MIVMITKLVEKNKRKAHQYWPEDAGEDPLGLVLDIGGGCSVEFVSSSYQGSYFLRQAKVFLKSPSYVGPSLSGSLTEVCKKWSSYRLRTGPTLQPLRSPGG